jgi:AraC-like DNA-binding protein
MADAGTPVAVMADRLGFSARQLHRRCLPAFGYGPRLLARVLRLGRSLEAARAGAPLAQVAADCGYADQAQLSREVRDLTGSSPTRLLQELVRGQRGEQVDRRGEGGGMSDTTSSMRAGRRFMTLDASHPRRRCLGCFGQARR